MMTDREATMTDQEVTRLLAEKIMGWKWIEPTTRPGHNWIERPDISRTAYWGKDTDERGWNPLELLSHAWMIVEKLTPRFCWSACSLDDKSIHFTFVTADTSPDAQESGSGSGDSLPRCICLAALNL